MAEKVLLGETILNLDEKEVSGEYTVLNGEDYFVIRNYDEMRPFFMSVVSASDHWLFISSNGALSAGRRDPDNALFPYYTDDKITDSVGLTGAKTIFRIETENGVKIWEPYNQNYAGLYNVTNNLYKNREGNKLIFEEINHDLELTFQYSWSFSDKYGIVKRSSLFNKGEVATKINVLDGIQNILPSGVTSGLQNDRSTLVDAYKSAILDKTSQVAIYALSSMIVDRAEPSEALKCTTVWSAGIDANAILLSSLQVNRFARSGKVDNEDNIKAEKGAFFIQSVLNLSANADAHWSIISEVNQSSSEVAKLIKSLKNRDKLYNDSIEDTLQNKEDLRKKIGLTDGIQLSDDRTGTGRHFSNVLFNIMRGGTFDDQYEIDTKDFIAHIKRMNRVAYSKLKTILKELPAKISYHQLRHFLQAAKHKEVMRYYYEYLPLSFSRRHGDPSRPWNFFSIETQTPGGKKSRNYQGNWRDIFQNWEALAYSYPEYSIGMITKFVNASTIDGYNPYRITRDGIDWEVIEPHDPWSYIGYWGDHQVIYLTKLLELSMQYQPDRLRGLLIDDIFTYANVPYRIKGYDAITADPKDTINFDQEVARKVDEAVARLGAEGKMVLTATGTLQRANLTEKLLVMVLTKLYNFIPEAGIWLNTQRPEWNDANNALVGNGVSMVTLYYLRRFLDFAKRLFADIEQADIELNKPVVGLMEALNRGFKSYQGHLASGFDDNSRRDFMDDFGIAGEHYRTTAYAGFTGEKRQIKITQILAFFAKANEYLEHSIQLNQRQDKLYHAYNLVELTDGKAHVSQLYEMLEGQVAVLSANCLNGKEVVEVLDALKSSKMYRPDQYSYMLYPDRELPSFLEKNCIQDDDLEHSELAELMLASGDKRVIERDVNGDLHFNGSFHNARDLDRALDNLARPEWKKLAKAEKGQFLAAFEKAFDHRSFTGRSGAFYGYEGLGSIYWHMVSKLLLAIQENIYQAQDEGADEVTIGKLVEHYYEIRAGIGVNKNPELYGAFPTDAYSHTPKYAGAKQPGMTGQVKEDIINRWAVLGVRVENGHLAFKPLFLRKSEFLTEAATLSYYDYQGKLNKLAVPADGMAFTYCQIPILYKIGKNTGIEVSYAEGTKFSSDKPMVELLDSKDIFKRTGKVQSITVTFTTNQLLN